MAKREKDRLYYEITREKPFGVFQTLMVGGAAGSVMGFLMASLVGALVGMEMDAVVLAFLAASFLGFFFGAVFTWLAVRYFGKWISDAALGGDKLETGPEPEATLATPEMGMEESQDIGAEAENDEAKGKSVDFVFPELSPDKQ